MTTTETKGPEARSGLVREFRDFLTTGDLMTIAVAFIMGAAVKQLIDSFVNDVVMGVIGLAVKCNEVTDAVTGKMTKDCTGIAGEAYETLRWGSFVNQTVVFLLTALAVFVLVKLYKGATKRDLVAGGPTETDLLAEIRDELRAQRG